MNGRIDAERILDAFLAPESDRLPDRVLDAALDDIARTPQRRAMRVPWRFPSMTNTMRAAAGIAIVAIVGVGVLVFNFRSPGSGTGTPAPSPTPTPTLTPAPSQVAPGITGWTTYTSAIHGFTISYPADWSVQAPATRRWQAGDAFPGDAWPYADAFVSPGEGDAQIGLFFWEMPAGEGAELESVQGLKVWAEAFCNEVGASACEAFAQGAVPMCLNPGLADCRAALLVPTAGPQFAFIPDWTSMILTGVPDVVTVVVIGREDSFTPAARYGGSVELLKAILTTMDVVTPAPGQVVPELPG